MTPPAPSQLALGLKLRDKGVAKVASASQEWIDLCLKEIEAWTPGGQIDADTLREWVCDPPHPNALGALFSIARKRGLVTFSHYEKSSRPSRHASVTGVWRRT